jgi:DNA-binding beta-propeller fold protein YncE
MLVGIISISRVANPPTRPTHTERKDAMVQLAIVCAALMVSGPSVQDAARDGSGSQAKVHTIKVGGDGGWDYLTVDSPARRLYVSRGDRVVVIDLDKEEVVGELKDTPGVHGVAVVPDLGKGFTSNGRDNSVTAFDLKTLKPLGNVKVGGNPDAIAYDATSNRVFTFNHGTKDATAVDPTAVTVAGTVPLTGVPEAAAPDGKGHVFVNLMDTNEIVEFDARSLKVLNRWSLAPGQRPTGLALDREHRRLFSVCSANQKMMVMNADTGAIVSTLDIGQGSDGCAFDAERGVAYSSNGRDGTLSVVKEDGPDKCHVEATIPTQRSARTMALDPKTHRVYLSAGTYAAPAAGQPKAKGRPPLVPGSFVIVVVGE